MVGYENKETDRIYTLKQTFKKHVDLLLLSNSINFHYVLIKGFDRFMTSETKYHSKKPFYWY